MPFGLNTKPTKAGVCTSTIAPCQYGVKFSCTRRSAAKRNTAYKHQIGSRLPILSHFRWPFKSRFPPAPTQDPRLMRFYEELKAFALDRDSETYTFPTTLNSYERRQVCMAKCSTRSQSAFYVDTSIFVARWPCSVTHIPHRNAAEIVH